MSQIDRYLDSLFDQLTGTGEHGRRLLLETEDHSRAAASDAAQRGLSPVAVEAEAIKRFGSLEVIAASLDCRSSIAGWAARFGKAARLAVGDPVDDGG